MTSSRTSTVVGLALAGVGAAHFVVPDAFLEITRLPHPDDTEEWVTRDGAIETALGLAILSSRTRRLGYLGLAGYAGWLAYAAAQNR